MNEMPPRRLPKYEVVYRPGRSGDPVWVTVSGGDLPMPVQLRVGKAADGRNVVTGLTIESDQFTEITSQTLRAIKLRELMIDVFEGGGLFDPLANLLNDATASSPVVSVQPKGPDGDALKAFARTYLTELARQPQRAMTATAAQHNISRATANRWAQECRRLGYLPKKPKGDKGND